jgi:hypothetical protein
MRIRFARARSITNTPLIEPAPQVLGGEPTYHRSGANNGKQKDSNCES